nr:hypothetical protein [Sunxiuqinia sp.]
MESNLLKLKNRLDHFPVFEENQVLTEEQLNQMVTYLDQQSRLSRRNLHGYGTVCGLHLSMVNRQMQLSRGCGLTSDGDLLEWPSDTVFPNVRLFKDDNVKYPMLQNAVVYELLPAGVKKEEQFSFSRFSQQTQKKLSDFAAMLYLESYLFDPDVCTGGDCDNKGQTQLNQLRVLLVPKSLASKQTSLLSAGKTFFQLSKLSIQRLVLTPGSIDSYTKLANAYQSIISSTSQSLQAALKSAYSQLSFLLSDSFNNQDPTPEWNQKLGQLAGAATTAGKQYRYAFLKDLVQAYNEFVDSCYLLNVACLPEISLSPKHVFIGDAAGQIEDKKDPFRQHFVETPYYSDGKEKLRRCLFFFNRIGALIESADFSNQEDLKITPSTLHACLGSRAIPAYYQVKGEAQLLEKWSFERTQKDEELSIYSYRAPEYSQLPEVRSPLSYDLTAYDHFRIEGHLGQPFRAAYETLQSMIRAHNLPIKALPIMIETDFNRAWVWPGLRYNGMEILHKLYRDELVNNLNELKVFNVELNSKVQAANDEELPPLNIESNSLSLKAFTAQQTNLVNQKITETKNFLAKSIVDFDHASFENNYKEVVSQGAMLNKGIKGVTFASAYTPLEKTVNDINFSKLKGLADLIKKREEKDKEKSMLQTFIEGHPGLEHTGGVPRGGTFVLLYSSSNGRVVADMSLPYWYVDESVSEVPEESDVSDNNLVLDWKFNNDIFVYTNQNSKLKESISKLNLQLDQFKFDLDTQKTNLNSYQGSINTLIQTIPNYQVDYGTIGGLNTNLKDRELANNLGLLNQMNDYKMHLENQINAGAATDAEKAVYNDMELVMAGIVEDTIVKTSKTSTDITRDSDEAKSLEMMVNVTKNLKTEGAVSKVRNTVESVKTESVAKENYLASLNMFKL